MQPQFVTAAQLAQLSGRNEKTIRRAIHAGRLPAERDKDGVFQIPTEAGLAVYPPKDQLKDVDETSSPEIDQVEDGEVLEAVASRAFERGARANGLYTVDLRALAERISDDAELGRLLRAILG